MGSLFVEKSIHTFFKTSSILYEGSSNCFRSSTLRVFKACIHKSRFPASLQLDPEVTGTRAGAMEDMVRYVGPGNTTLSAQHCLTDMAVVLKSN